MPVITRYNDYEYRFFDDSNLKEYNIHFDNKIDTPVPVLTEIANRLINKLNQMPDPAKHDVYIKVNDEIYLVEAESSMIAQLASWTGIIKNFKNASRQDLSITKLALQKIPIDRDKVLDLGTTPVVKDLAKTMPVKNEDEVFSFETKMKRSAYSDPYTSLAAEAFQRYAKDYGTKDRPVDSEFFIANLKGTSFLTLVPESEKKNVNYSHPTQSLINFYAHIVAEYGLEKVQYIEKAYDLNFQKMIDSDAKLTPEIVFRVNMGAENLEIQDLNRIYAKLPALVATAEASHADSLLTFLSGFKENPDWSHRELRGIYQQISYLHPEPTVADLIDWLQPLVPFQESVENLTSDQFHQLLSLCKLTPDEEKLQSTGRTLTGPVGGWYTVAEKKQFKPWLDQHEFLHTQREFESRPTVDHFYEKLSYVWCKQHLLRVHPTESYRVGALIPGPASETGAIDYFKVTEMINNGRGILVYTLEPVLKDSNQPFIKIYRSTASDPYQVDSSASVLNDFNPFNSPGYEGSVYMDKYEREFFDQCTIPVWAGYQMVAEQEVEKLSSDPSELKRSDLMEIHGLLLRASEEMEKDIRQETPHWKLHEIIRREDSEFLDLLTEMNKNPDVSITDQISMLLMLIRNSTPKEPLTPDIYAQQREDAEQICRILKSYPAIPRAERLAQLIDYHFLYTNQVMEEKRRHFAEAHASTLVDLDTYKKRLEVLFNTTPFDHAEARALLKSWSTQIKSIADAKNENPTGKKQRSIAFAGHSLGGACAQRFFLRYTSDSNRILLPGQTCELRTFDEPGINAEDNEKFKAFGNKHRDLLQRLGMQFKIVRRQEVGDIVAMGGEVHLGATFSPAEEAKVAQWLQFDAAVQDGLPHSTLQNIRDALYAHGTQFERGSPRQARRVETLEKIDRSLLSPEKQKMLETELKVAKGDFMRIGYGTRMQGLFDRPGDPMQWEAINELWRMPLVQPQQAEELRKYFGGLMRTFCAFNTSRKRDYVEDPLHGNWRALRDPDGVFAVSGQGIISSESIQK